MVKIKGLFLLIFWSFPGNYSPLQLRDLSIPSERAPSKHQHSSSTILVAMYTSCNGYARSLAIYMRTETLLWYYTSIGESHSA